MCHHLSQRHPVRPIPTHNGFLARFHRCIEEILHALGIRIRAAEVICGWGNSCEHRHMGLAAMAAGTKEELWLRSLGVLLIPLPMVMANFAALGEGGREHK
jgi:hypothetical protein